MEFKELDKQELDALIGRMEDAIEPAIIGELFEYKKLADNCCLF